MPFPEVIFCTSKGTSARAGSNQGSPLCYVRVAMNYWLPYTYDLPQFNHVIGLKYWKCFCIVWTDLCWKGKNSSWKQHLSMDGKLQLCLLLIHVTTVRRGKNILFVIEKVRKISGLLPTTSVGWMIFILKRNRQLCISLFGIKISIFTVFSFINTRPVANGE